ncbi:MAG: ribbon-helix-helix protein, CopG family [Chloroflexi bacterium]|nr:ribbon-helix-helix protein, CopG family [Chloroflexota bacterium]
MVRTQIQLTEKQSENLRRLAEVDNISMAELIRRSVDAYIQTRQEVSTAERERRLLSVIGIGQSGTSDLGANHDTHLADIYAEVGE